MTAAKSYLTRGPQRSDRPGIRPGFYGRFGKRALDVVVASFALIAISPFVLVVALLSRVLLGSPVLYRQVRLGRDGETFEVIKFRSMKPCRRVSDRPISHPDRRKTHKSAQDPRHTKFGRILRKSSIDEIPQFLNVVRGEMSLVGPRPEIVEIATEHNLVGHARHNVRPGMTGSWQVSIHRPGHLYENLHYDVQYLDEMSFQTDLKVMLKTIAVLLRSDGQ